MVFHGDQFGYIIHKRAVTFDFTLLIKALSEHKVQVAFKGVTKDDRFVVVVFIKQGLQITHASREFFYRKGHIFNDDRSTHFAHGSHRREHAFTNTP
ncbi:Uncharacterised protein [Vibrio cholerae]|nr:Uncharacterised protein [Vibrio cholerae]CRZ83141.1 Uncharacterised protein [Vibrio cholerae]CSA33605.1 Uncharacterised protein [Vibrio cholerae]CSB24083.1 Uncharacterised protein [Vibrio cholerae]CSC45628.1 Uncharacterised protein [Vibrio cholerae]